MSDPAPSGAVIGPAEGAADIDAARTLFREYAESLNYAQCFSCFDRELASLPGRYTPPAGRLLLARADGEPAGVVGLSPVPEEDGAGEMRRLYVRPAFRGLGLGRRLAEAVVAAARAEGYRVLRLDTLDGMDAAQRLYGALGFTARPAADPARPVRTFELRLTA